MPKPQDFKYSVIIPAYNSESIIGETLDRTVSFFEQQGWEYEIIVVNDGSLDDTWSVIHQKAQVTPQIVAVDLLQNYGQHTALFAGLQNASGDYVVTIDDDLQNPPEEIEKLVAAALEHDYDVVYGRFERKQHASYRRLGSYVIMQINRRIFGQPPDLIVTNFRLIRRDVVERVCQYRTPYPYITGLSLMFSNHRGNEWVHHHPRKVGGSNYNFSRLAALVARILFNYSSFPLRFVSGLGFTLAVLGIFLGIYYLLRALISGFAVPGWATIIVLMSLFNSVNLLVVSMLGEYIIRLVRQSSQAQVYYVRKKIDNRIRKSSSSTP